MKKNKIKPKKIRKKKFKYIHAKKGKKYSFLNKKTLKICNSILLLIIYLYLENAPSLDNNSNLIDNKVTIIETKEYKSFNELKEKETSPFLKSILKEINIIKHIFDKNIEKYKKNKNIIHLSASINNDKNYKYIILVSIFSVLLNCNKQKTFIIYHISCSRDFNETSVEIFKSLINKFPKNVEMIFYNMGNLFDNRKNARYSEAAYFRLLAPVFINSDRLIHLDGDTLTFADLNEMYNLDFNDNYVLGMYDILADGVDYLGIKSKIYICAGTLLLNLKKLREDNKIVEIMNLTNSNIELKNVDQTVVNYLFHPKIGRLSSKYVMFNYEEKSDLLFYINRLRTKITLEEMEEAVKNPTIIHYTICWPKVWNANAGFQAWASTCSQRNNCSCKKDHNLWHSFAKQTNYYDEIAHFTGVKKINSNEIK